MARAKSRGRLLVPGTNGYNLEIHDMDDNTAQFVIVGATTGKRHANISTDRHAAACAGFDLQAIFDDEGDSEGLEVYGDYREIVAQPKECYL